MRITAFSAELVRSGLATPPNSTPGQDLCKERVQFVMIRQVPGSNPFNQLLKNISLLEIFPHLSRSPALFATK